GVDIETIGEAPCAKLIAQFCSARERRALAKLSGTEQARAFARIWTLKEAYAKLTGTGLAADFRFLEFGAGPELSTVDCQAHRTRGETRFESWLTEAPGALYQVAVAVGGTEAAAGRGGLVCFAVEDGIDISQSRTLNAGGGLQANLAIS
ncbi:MAG TPA: 4'-phosphopantetheinyl transferase superfamily protein, partial [Hyphomicrobiaceae bacterium]|nr:4'-phosphopantetheinyl transferase superfamily protein [Hyphomicrobiaceae bacterium]